MTTIDLNKLELAEFTGKNDAKQHCHATFPLIGANGSKDLASVYFELAPGDHLGRHTDSAEELLLILEGEVEIEIDGEFSNATMHQMALVPKMVSHNITNVGDTPAKVLGIFGGANNIIATFEMDFIPTNSNVVDTSLMG